ncbi:MAG: hypothetical protein LWX83_08425 [Anaerolineae bacterium]|nr:hypothetical protein [Anaerolineae bacterium]
MNKKRLIRQFIFWGVLSFLLAACAPVEQSPLSIKQTQTGAAITVQAQLTATKAARPTKTPLKSTETPTPLPTFTELPPLDQAQLIEQRPDNGSNIAKSFDYDMVWTVKNTGTTTWTPDYYIAFWGGDRIGDGLPTAYFLQKDVKPGEITSLIAHMKSPLQTGNYRGIWFFMNDKKEGFFDLNISLNVQ